jgi:K+/H+ antiporter YhaU regulatory subunit KhtT
VPRETGCSVVALRTAAGLKINPAANEVMQAGQRIILICTPEAEQRFLERYGAHLSPAQPG